MRKKGGGGLLGFWLKASQLIFLRKHVFSTLPSLRLHLRINVAAFPFGEGAPPSRPLGSGATHCIYMQYFQGKILINKG